MTQHTQGPWNVAKPNCGLGIFDANGKSVAAIAPTQKRTWAEKEANARLIAAAPDMASALKELVRKHEAGFAPSNEDWTFAIQALIDAGIYKGNGV